MDNKRKVLILGVFFIVLSIILYALDYKFTTDLALKYLGKPPSEIKKDPLFWITFSLENYAIPFTFSTGVILLVSAFLRNRWIYAILYSIACWSYPIIFGLLPENIVMAYANVLYIYAHGVVPGILAGILIANYFIRVDFQKEFWVIIFSMIFGPLLAFPNLVAILKIVGVGIGTWLIWHFLTPLIAKLEIKGIKEDEIAVKLKSYKGPTEEDITKWTVILLAFSYGIASIIATFYHFLGPSEFEQALEIVIYSYAVMLGLSVFAIPVKWLLNSYGLRLVNSRTLMHEPMEKIALVEETSAASFVISLFLDLYEQSPEFYKAIIFTYLMTVTLLPSATIATLLYYLFSIRKHWVKLRKMMMIFEVENIRDVLNIKLPPPPPPE